MKWGNLELRIKNERAEDGKINSKGSKGRLKVEVKDKECGNFYNISLAEAQRAQRKTRYAGDQNCEKAQFWSHFMPLQGRSKLYPQGVRVYRYESFSHTGKNIPLCELCASARGRIKIYFLTIRVE